MECNGMNHSARMRYWLDQLKSSPAFNTPGPDLARRRWKHVFVCVSWLCEKFIQQKQILKMIGNMTYVIHEDNPVWAGVRDYDAVRRCQTCLYANLRRLLAARGRQPS